MSKKLIITLSVLFSVLATVLILFWTLFALSNVSVQFSSTLKNLKLTETEIVEAGNFRKGACVLFEGKKKSIEKIYAKASENENFAYIKITNIETKFPNKFVVHVAEREELFAVESKSGQVLICDRDFRVLRLAREEEFQTQETSLNNKKYVSTQNNAMLLSGLEIENENVKVGQFLKIKQTAMRKFYANMLLNNRNLAQQLGKFQMLELSDYADEITKKEYVKLTLKTFAGRVFEIKNIDFAFAHKIQKMFSAESAMFSGEVESKDIWCVRNEKGEYATLVKVIETDQQGQEIEKYVPVTSQTEGAVKLSYEILFHCKIVVDNLTLDENVHRTEKDVYYSFVDLN